MLGSWTGAGGPTADEGNNEKVLLSIGKLGRKMKKGEETKGKSARKLKTMAFISLSVAPPNEAATTL